MFLADRVKYRHILPTSFSFVETTLRYAELHRFIISSTVSHWMLDTTELVGVGMIKNDTEPVWMQPNYKSRSQLEQVAFASSAL